VVLLDYQLQHNQIILRLPLQVQIVLLSLDSDWNS